MVTSQPCILLANEETKYEVLSFNREIGKIVIRSEYGVELAVTTEEADRNGYKAVKGWKMQDPKVEGHMKFVTQ